jgi:mono/diheme cytochrome c family protein
MLALIATASHGYADMMRGKQLSEALCSRCHSIVAGKPSPNPKAPSFARSAADPSITVYSLRAFLRTSHSTMPNIILKPDDMDDIAEYLLSLAPKR